MNRHFQTLTVLTLLVSGAAAFSFAVEPPAAYQYGGGRFRDPFTPLTGAGAGASFAFGEEGAFDLEGIMLKGILEDRSGGRFATISDKSGVGYLVKDGKILDGRGKPVKGVTGIVKRKSIIFITGDKKVKEVPLEKPEESGGTP